MFIRFIQSCMCIPAHICKKCMFYFILSQAYTKNKNELERFLFKHQDDTEEEKVKVKENLDFTLANIQGLTEELNQLRGQSVNNLMALMIVIILDILYSLKLLCICHNRTSNLTEFQIQLTELAIDRK